MNCILPAVQDNKNRFMKQVISFLLLIVYSCFANAQPWKDFRYQNGDLLFQDIDCGDLCDAIEAVTPALNGKHFSHTGIVYLEKDSVYIIEAIGENVHITPLQKFLQRQLDSAGHPKVVVGRLKPQYRALNKPAVQFALKQTGKPYDDVFIYSDDKYYCSELVYDAYKAANKGKPFFKLYPMTFKDPQSRHTFPAWTDYYKQLGVAIPEGAPGCNPGSIATSGKIDIIAIFY